MVDIVLKHLSLTNFKGIRDLKIDFTDGINEIKGANATGKTSLFDAFLWVLFGKDSLGKKDFDVKTLDKNGNEIPRVEHSVTAVISVDGNIKTFTRTLREKWSKKRGSTEETFTGNETLYEVDNVLCKMAEYQKIVSDLINENLFKLITNPTQFCSLKWQEQKEVLTSIANLGTDKELAENEQLDYVVQVLDSGKSIEDKAKELANTKKKINKELEQYPTRIDEVKRTLPALDAREASEIQNDISNVKAKINCLQNEIFDIQNGDEILKKAESERSLAESELKQAKAEYNAKLAEVENYNKKLKYENQLEKDKLQTKIDGLKKHISESSAEITGINKMLEKLRDEYTSTYKQEFTDTCCPCCGRPWEDDDLEQKKAEFLKKRSENLQNLSERGKKLNESVEYNNKSIEDKKGQIDVLLKDLEALNKELQYKELPAFDDSEFTAKINKSNEVLQGHKPDTSQQEADLKLLNDKLADFEAELALVNSAKKQRERITELENEMQIKIQAVADIEKNENIINIFNDKKTALLDKEINSRFKYVKFKFRNELINGGYEDCCEPLVDGVPYSRNLNNGAKINAGLDIINTLQQHYSTYAPVFIDNKESVNKPLDLNCQTIYLTVTEDDKLVINKNKEAV